MRALERVQIADPEAVADRYPHQLSGGMQQRVVIAIALASDPKLLVLDEPTTGLDATVEASVLDLVRKLQAETNAAVLLIAHNLGVIRTLCDRVGVMYAGKIVEEGDAATVFADPKHPYTLGLLRSLPRRGVRKSERALSTIPGNLPQIGTNLPTCVFVDRCQLADELCRTVVPPVVEVGNGQWSRCHHIDRLGEMVEPPSIVGADTVGGDGRAGRRRRVEDLPPERPRRAGAGRRRPRAARRRDARARRRVGLGQVDPGADDPRHRGPGRRRHDRARRARPRGQVEQPADRGQARPPDGLPEPRLGAQSRLDRAPHPVALGQQADRAQGQGRQRAGRQAGRGPAAHPAPPRPQAAPAVRRPQAAAWRSPGRSPATRGSSSPTSRRARSTSRSRPRSSTCCPSCRPRAGRATCSSRTTSASSATSPTGSR